jgi:hypothetical protein
VNLKPLQPSIPTQYAITIVIALFAAVLGVFHPSYETSDDTMMNYIAAGTFNGEPSQYLVFSNYLEGVVLKWLFIRFPEINWYPLFLYSIQLLAFVQITYVLNKANNSRLFFGLYLLLYTIFIVYVIINLQFTSTAFLVGIAGLLTLLHLIKNNNTSLLSMVKMTGFLLLCVLVRWESYVGLLVITAPVLVYHVRKPVFSKKHVIYGVTLLLPFLLVYANLQFYKSISSTHNYINYQLSTHKILDYDSDMSASTLQQVDLTPTDYNLLNTYFWADDKVFTQEKIVQLAGLKSNELDIPKGADVLINYATSFLFYGALLVFIGLCFLFANSHQRKNIVVYTIFIHLLLLFLASYLKLPLRLYLPLCFTVVMMILYEVSNHIQTTNLSIKSKVVGLLLVITAITQTGINRNISNYHKALSAQNENAIKLVESHPETLFIDIDYSDQLHRPSLFAVAPRIKGNNLIDGASFINTPTYHSLLEKNNIKNLTIDIVGRPAVFISNDAQFYSNYRQFMREHYGVECGFVPYIGLEDALEIVWR